MPRQKPWEFYPQLTESRLALISRALLDVYYDVQRELSTNLDDNYTRGTTTFGRHKNRIIELYQSKDHSWLDLRSSSNDLVFTIGGIPFRFFRDDHEKPKKPGFWRRNVQDNLFPTDQSDPVYWRFIVQKPLTEEAEASVYVVGANSNQEIVCEWKHDDFVRVLTTTDESRAEAIETPEPEVGLPAQENSQKRSAKPGS